MVAVAPSSADWLSLGHKFSVRKAVIRFGLPSSPPQQASLSAAPKPRPASCPRDATATGLLELQQKPRARAPSAGRAAAASGEPLLLSKGSAGHMRGECRPCAWRWKPSGCSNGIDCLFCHVCDQGALKIRKQERQRVLKNARLKQMEAADGCVDATSPDSAVPACAAVALPTAADPNASVESHSASDVRCLRWTSCSNQVEEPFKSEAPPGLQRMSACEAWLQTGFDCEHWEMYQL